MKAPAYKAVLGFCSLFPSTRSREEKGETEKDALKGKQNYDKCVMSQVLSEIGLAFSAEKNIMLLDKFKTIFLPTFFCFLQLSNRIFALHVYLSTVLSDSYSKVEELV